MTDDRLFVEAIERWNLPHEDASVPGYVKHVYCEGARSHVLRWSGYLSRKTNDTVCIERCSEPDCIINYEAEKREKEHGLRP